jgi:hypothetical protein
LSGDVGVALADLETAAGTVRLLGETEEVARVLVAVLSGEAAALGEALLGDDRAAVRVEVTSRGRSCLLAEAVLG